METKKNTAWMYPELDLEELYHDGHFEKVVQVATENIDLVMSHYRNANYEVLERSIRTANVMASYLERSVQAVSDQALIAAGKLMGCIETLEKIQYENERNRAVFAQSRLLGTKHLDRIVQILEDYGPLSQTQMGEILELQASTLSEVLKKVRMTNLIQSSPYGKYKMYSLTEEGVRYSKSIRSKKLYIPNNKPSDLNVEAAIKTLQLYLEDEQTRDLCLGRMQETLGVVVGPGSQLSLHDPDRHHVTKFAVEEIASEGNAAEISIQGETIDNFTYEIVFPCLNTMERSKANLV